jgi:RNA polymerase sigma-70 factor, ECF subfamily
MEPVSRQRRGAALRVMPGEGAKGPTDEELMAAVLAGDTRVADQIYSRLYDTVDRTLYRIFGRREADHEDLIQKAFEQIVITLVRGSFAGACSLKTWASSVTSRVAFNALRSRKRERKVFELSAASMPGDLLENRDSRGLKNLEGQTLARAELADLREALLRLNPSRASAVFLHDVLGHELAEIAVMEGVTVAAAQSRLVRGRADLYSLLGRMSKPKAHGGGP